MCAYVIVLVCVSVVFHARARLRVCLCESACVIAILPDADFYMTRRARGDIIIWPQCEPRKANCPQLFRCGGGCEQNRHT